MSSKRVIIIGGGLAGLCAARECERCGTDWQLFESSPRLGGRVGTRMIEGCRIDHGFAVLLTAYPELIGVIDLKRLDLRAFQSGALIRRGGSFARVANPLRHPLQSITAALSGAIGPIDGCRILPIALRAAFARSVVDPDARYGISAHDRLRRAGISRRLIDSFFRPFFGGVFLDGSLGADAAAFEYRLAMFARGAAALPREGMGQISAQLIEQISLARTTINLAVTAISKSNLQPQVRWMVRTADGASHAAQSIIVALDADGARALVPTLPTRAWCSTAAISWRVESARLPQPLREPILVLDGDGRGPINHMCALTSVVTEYAPHGIALISANVIDPTALAKSDADLERDARTQMSEWFGADTVRAWNCLNIERIARALPRQHPDDLFARPKMDQGNGLILAGDYVCDGSINGAMRSGRLAAQLCCA